MRIGFQFKAVFSLMLTCYLVKNGQTQVIQTTECSKAAKAYGAQVAQMCHSGSATSSSFFALDASAAGSVMSSHSVTECTCALKISDGSAIVFTDLTNISPEESCGTEIEITSQESDDSYFLRCSTNDSPRIYGTHVTLVLRKGDTEPEKGYNFDYCLAIYIVPETLGQNSEVSISCESPPAVTPLPAVTPIKTRCYTEIQSSLQSDDSVVQMCRASTATGTNFVILDIMAAESVMSPEVSECACTLSLLGGNQFGIAQATQIVPSNACGTRVQIRTYRQTRTDTHHVLECESTAAQVHGDSADIILSRTGASEVSVYNYDYCLSVYLANRVGQTSASLMLTCFDPKENPVTPTLSPGTITVSPVVSKTSSSSRMSSGALSASPTENKTMSTNSQTSSSVLTSTSAVVSSSTESSYASSTESTWSNTELSGPLVRSTTMSSISKETSISFKITSISALSASSSSSISSISSPSSLSSSTTSTKTTKTQASSSSSPSSSYSSSPSPPSLPSSAPSSSSSSTTITATSTSFLQSSSSSSPSSSSSSSPSSVPSSTSSSSLSTTTATSTFSPSSSSPSSSSSSSPSSLPSSSPSSSLSSTTTTTSTSFSPSSSSPSSSSSFSSSSLPSSSPSTSSTTTMETTQPSSSQSSSSSSSAPPPPLSSLSSTVVSSTTITATTDIASSSSSSPPPLSSLSLTPMTTTTATPSSSYYYSASPRSPLPSSSLSLSSSSSSYTTLTASSTESGTTDSAATSPIESIVLGTESTTIQSKETREAYTRADYNFTHQVTSASETSDSFPLGVVISVPVAVIAIAVFVICICVTSRKSYDEIETNSQETAVKSGNLSYSTGFEDTSATFDISPGYKSLFSDSSNKYDRGGLHMTRNGTDEILADITIEKQPDEEKETINAAKEGQTRESNSNPIRDLRKYRYIENETSVGIDPGDKRSGVNSDKVVAGEDKLCVDKRMEAALAMVKVWIDDEEIHG